MDIRDDGLPVFTFYVDQDEKAQIVCPKCGDSRLVEAARFQDFKTSLRIRCTCGEVFKGVLDYRRSYRKSVNLPCRYTNIATSASGQGRVVDLSLGGLQLQVKGDSRFSPQDILEVCFKLDNPDQSVICKRVEIRSVRGDRIGVAFCKDQPRDPELGFYLM